MKNEISKNKQDGLTTEERIREKAYSMVAWITTIEELLTELDKLFVIIESKEVADEGAFTLALSEQIEKIKELHKKISTT